MKKVLYLTLIQLTILTLTTLPTHHRQEIGEEVLELEFGIVSKK